MINQIMFLENDIKITSVELVKVINSFREIEGKKQLLHKNLMAKIKKELETLESIGIVNQLNFQPVEYTDTKGEKRPCYNINREGMLMLLNSESTLVRYKTSEYIKNLENAYYDLKFKIGDKKHQLECMKILQHLLPEELKKDKIPYIIINKQVNKITSRLYGFPKTLKKVDMNKDMLEDREKIMDDYLKLYEVFKSNRKCTRFLEEKYIPKLIEC